MEFAHQAACKIVCVSGNARARREVLKFFLERFQGFIYEIPKGWEKQKSGLCRLSAVPSSHQHKQQLWCALTKYPPRAWARLEAWGAGEHAQVLCPQGSRGALPAIPQEGKTNMILTYFAHGPSCLCSLFYQPPLPHSLALFLLESAASLPLPTPLRSPCYPVDGCLGPLKKGFVASFSTSEKLRAGCPVLSSLDRIVLL